MISANCAPMMLGRVWVGETCPTPRLLAQALNDPEDDPPHYRAQMPNDDADERENTNTITMPPPPPPSEPSTRLENEKPAPLKAIAPPAPSNPFAEPPPWWEGSFFQAVFNDVQGAAEAIKKASAGQDAILAAVERADSNSTRNYEMLRDEIRHLKDSDLKQDQRLKEGDKRFEEIEKRLAGLEAKFESALGPLLTEALKPFAEEFDEIRKLVADWKADVSATAATPPRE